MKKISLILLLLIFTSHCGGGIVATQGNNGPNGNSSLGNQTTPESFAQATVHQDLFSLGSDFPPDIQIPSLPGMTSTAFVLTFSPPAVLPFDLDSDPLSFSNNFSVFDASSIPEGALPNNLWIQSSTQAFLLGSTGVVMFNPSTGETLQVLPLNNPINLSQTLPYSMPGDCDLNSVPEGSVGPGLFTPSFPGDIAVVQNRLFVTMSNACFDASFESFYIQGILLVFDLNPTPPFLTPAATPFLILPGFNSTGITVRNQQLIVTSTGDTTLVGGDSIPQTVSFLAQINPTTLKITGVLNLGLVAANFRPLAITSDGSRGYIGSSSFSEVYEIDLVNFSILRGENNPIAVFGNQPDFISDQVMAFGDQILFVSSFNHSGVKAIDLAAAGAVLPELLDFAPPGNPGITGAGPMALRPGQPNVDYTGPDLWVLTSNPGTLGSALTY